MNETPPTYYNVNEEDLKEILEFAEQGISPIVKYSDDPVQMLKSAYEARGARLVGIKHRILNYLQK